MCCSYRFGEHPGRHYRSYGVRPTDQYVRCPMTPQGIAALCDWALLVPCLYGTFDRPPRTVFVHHFMLQHFINLILPYMPKAFEFVLVSSGTDLTIPTSMGDIRFTPLRGFSNNSLDEGGPHWQLLTSHPQIMHWYCENHDLTHPRVSTLPTGIVRNIKGMDPLEHSGQPSPMKSRPLRFLVAHRLRSMRGQWELRKNVSVACLRMQLTHDLCMYPRRPVSMDNRKGINKELYIKLITSVPFVLCVHGGGLDPSPKAWEAIMLGTIPIIQHSTLDDAYEQLPVVFVRSWQVLFEGNLTAIKSRLQGIVEALSPYYDDPIFRRPVVEVRAVIMSSF